MIAVFDNERGVGRGIVSSLDDTAILNTYEPLFGPIEHRMTPIHCGCRSLNRIDGCIFVADHRAVGYSRGRIFEADLPEVIIRAEKSEAHTSIACHFRSIIHLL